jgi:hypothetical protein
MEEIEKCEFFFTKKTKLNIIVGGSLSMIVNAPFCRHPDSKQLPGKGNCKGNKKSCLIPPGEQN